MDPRSASAGVVTAATDLDVLFDQVHALHVLAQDPVLSADEGVVYDFSIRWGTMMAGRWLRLVHYHDRGELAAEDQARYEALCTELERAAPLIAELRLAQPTLRPDHSTSSASERN